MSGFAFSNAFTLASMASFSELLEAQVRVVFPPPPPVSFEHAPRPRAVTEATRNAAATLVCRMGFLLLYCACRQLPRQRVSGVGGRCDAAALATSRDWCGAAHGSALTLEPARETTDDA